MEIGSLYFVQTKDANGGVPMKAPTLTRPPRIAAGGLVLAVLLACGANEPEPVEIGPDGVAVLPEEGGTKRITPEQVAWLREQGVEFLFVDSRSRGDWVAGRPAGSVNVPLDLTELAATRLPGDRLIITFCT